jgi:hypothetical protein
MQSNQLKENQLSTTSLYKIESELIELFNEVTENHGEMTEELELKISQLNNAITEKVDSCYGYRMALDDFSELIDLKINELKAKSEQINKKKEKFDNYVNNCLELSGKKELIGQFYRITKRKPSVVVEIFNESDIPMEFIKTPEPKPIIMKAEIKKALESGQEVKGAKLSESKNISIEYKIKR